MSLWKPRNYELTRGQSLKKILGSIITFIDVVSYSSIAYHAQRKYIENHKNKTHTHSMFRLDLRRFITGITLTIFISVCTSQKHLIFRKYQINYVPMGQKYMPRRSRMSIFDGCNRLWSVLRRLMDSSSIPILSLNFMIHWIDMQLQHSTLFKYSGPARSRVVGIAPNE